MTHARSQATVEADRTDQAWRTVIRDAAHDAFSPTRLAAAAGISRERVYQLKDGRR